MSPEPQAEPRTRVIHDGSLRSTHCNSNAMGAPPDASRSTHCTKRSNGSPACRRERRERTGDPLLCRVQRVISTVTD